MQSWWTVKEISGLEAPRVYIDFLHPIDQTGIPERSIWNDRFAVAADNHGAVWISFETDNIGRADRFHVLGGKAERRLPQVTPFFIYRAPDKTFWFSGKRCLWHLVGNDLVHVDLPPGMADQYGVMQTISADRQGVVRAPSAATVYTG